MDEEDKVTHAIGWAGWQVLENAVQILNSQYQVLSYMQWYSGSLEGS